MGGLDDHHAAVVAGDSKALAINNVVGNAGLTVGRIQAWQYWKPGEVVFIKAIGRALTTYGDEIVGRVLSMIGRAFKDQVLVGVGALRSEERRVGKRVSVRVDLGGRRQIKKKKKPT